MADDIIGDDSAWPRGIGRRDFGDPGKALHVDQRGSAASLANGQATAGAASGQLVAARATRRSVTVRNIHESESCFIGTGTVSAASGFLLKAGESISIDCVGAVNGIRAGGTNVTVAYLETYD